MSDYGIIPTYDTHILVLGTPRTGTTLLLSLLGWHPEVVAMSECWSCEESKIVSPASVVINKLCTPYHIHFRHPPSRSLPERLVWRYWTKPVAKWTGRILEDRPRASTSISEYVDKRDARMIIILRTPDQSIDSEVRRGLSEDEAVSRWAHGIRELRQTYHAFPERCHLLTFTDLVHNVRLELKRACPFIGIPFDEKMMEGYQGTPQYDRDDIDPSIAEKDVPDYGLETRKSDERNAYQKLKQMAG